MRILVVADIHANRAALDAITEPFDACVCLGDLVEYGPHPAECIDWVRTHATACVRGNHDHGAVQDVPVIGTVGFRYLTMVSRRVTVPALWDRETNTILNNESRELMRIFDVDLAVLSRDPMEPTLAPPELIGEIDRVLDAIYEPINNGVYRAGFATTQAAYEVAVHDLFAALAYWDAVLGDQPFLCGARMTEADVALFTTLLRFDIVYYAHFKCNVKRLRDHANLWRFTRRMYQHPGIQPTCHLDDIKKHYYWSQPTVNPTRIIPCGPALEAELATPL